MAYQTGSIGNSHSLVDKIYGFMISIGWTLVATLKTGGNNPAPDGYDWVFHSDGEFGQDDIYVRIAAGESDYMTGGDVQHPYTDGYTGFINAFGYQYFPSAGTVPEDGDNEIGKFGPTLYIDDTDSDTVFEYNLTKSTNSTPVFRTATVSYSNWSISPYMAAFDGKRFIYNTGSSDYLQRGDLFDGSGTYRYDALGATYMANTPYVSLDDGTDRIYSVSQNTQAGSELMRRYNVNSNTVTSTNIHSPPWGDVGQGNAGCMCIGPKRKRQDANYFLYFWQGGYTAGSSVRWSQMNLDNESFKAQNVPATWGIGHWTSYRPCALFVTKEQSGYEHDRIYLWGGANLTNFGSIAIDDDGYVAEPAWVMHTSTPYAQAVGQYAVCVGRTIIASGSTSGNNAQSMYKFTLPSGDPTQAGSWTFLNNPWHQSPLNSHPYLFALHDHLAGRVRVSEFETNTYWLFGDKNRLVVVVKNGRGEYEYLYAGRFQPYANEEVTTLVSDISSGAIHIEVDDSTMFSVNKKYMIVDTTGTNSSIHTSELTGVARRLSPSEMFTVIENDGSGLLLITKLSSAYAAGSRIGEDPVPTTVRAHSIEKAMTLNNISTVNQDDYSDPSWQYYDIRATVDATFSNATDIEERSLGTFLYSYVLINQGDSYTGKEVRGQLINVFSCGTSIASEEEVAVGSKTYIAFDIAGSGETQRIVVGPK